jgi:hypothetical protein
MGSFKNERSSSVNKRDPATFRGRLQKGSKIADLVMRVIDSIHKLLQEQKRVLTAAGRIHFAGDRILKEKSCVLQVYAERGAQLRLIWCH